MTLGTLGPLARQDGLIVTHTGDDTIVYDSETGRLHTLNGAMAAIWRQCDGHRTREQLAALVTHEHASLAASAIDDALSRLDAAGLIEIPLSWGMASMPTSRRRLLKRSAIAGATIVSITVPMATAHASSGSCSQPFEPCGVDADCCPGARGEVRFCSPRDKICIT